MINLKYARARIYSVSVYLIILLFLFNTVSYGIDCSSGTLSPPMVTQKGSLNPGAEDVLSEIKFLTVAFSIADHFLDPSVEKGSSLKETLLEKFNYSEDFLAEQQIELKSVFASKGIVSFNFTKNGSTGLISICPRELGEALQASGEGWEIVGKYAFHVLPGKATEDDSDLKGQEAPDTDPIIRGLIEKERIVEVFIDPATGTLKANRVLWVKDYVPMITSQGLYLGQEVAIRQLFTELEQASLEAWMRANSIRGSPVKFRIALGRPALGWDTDIEHSNISHAGVRDGVIYIGGMLLRYLLRPENAALRSDVLDKDESRHLKGLDHGTKEEYLKRLTLVKDLINENKLLEIRQALVKSDVYFLMDEIRSRLDDPASFLKMLSSMNDFIMSRPLYPVESGYPIKKAVALLTEDEQQKLINILTGPQARIEGYNKEIVADDILQMFADAEVVKIEMKEWIQNNAPELQGRSLWQISPEIWHEAGGLARVMQYHGAAILDLIGASDVRLRHIEPHYQNRTDANGEAAHLDYTNGRQLTHPIVDGLEEIDKFTVNVQGKDVNVVVSRGVNDLGIEVFLVRDVQDNGESYYTHSLYNYRNLWQQNTVLPTWEEFSVFYSKASLEFVRRFESVEREKQGEAWKAPVMHLNDSQVALISVYRKIQFDTERAKKQKNPGHFIDPVLEHAIIAFSTHTYGNRKEYDLDNGFGDGVLDFMDIPREYRELFKHQESGWRSVYDMASAGLRTADWQGAVSRAHRDDVSKFDEWINSPGSNALDKIFKKFLAYVKVVAVSNGDHRANSAGVFRDIMKKLYGEKADPEHPSPEQIREIKKAAKKQLRLASGQVFYTTQDVTEGTGILDPEQPVVSYSGRLVPEKAGRKRAFTNENIKSLLERGVQVVIYGNVQVNNSLSGGLKDELVMLVEEIRREQEEGGVNYKGRLVFVPRFSLKDQRALLAATDIQVQDSDPETEAAGYTEADVSSCGGLELAPYRDDNYVGEGLLAAQGMPLDLDKPGVGNTLIPASGTPESYLDILNGVLDMGLDRLSRYQATSVRFSRILEARLTSAAYLREFSKAVADKQRKARARRAAEEIEKIEQQSRSLLAQLHAADDGKDPKGYAVYQISRLALNGETEKAVKLFFTCQAFQDEPENLDTPVEIFNRLIKAYADVADTDQNKAAAIKDFAYELKRNVAELSSDKEVSRAVQLIAGQALTIILWIDRKLPTAREMRLTADISNMSSNDKHGKSYIDKNILAGSVKEVKREGLPGFYWRGTETVQKIGSNISEKAMYDKSTFDRVKDNMVMYLMDHGFIGVPESMRSDTEDGKISTIHETFFLNDTLPGSFQSTSTGAGHFQGTKLDIKHVTDGWGIQFNVRYNADGSIAEVFAQEVKAGDLTLALPGCKDYMINLGGLRFNDISVELSSKGAEKFNPFLDFSSENLGSIKAIAEADNTAPYLALRTGYDAYLLKNTEDTPGFKWVSGYDMGAGMDLLNEYGTLSPGRLAEMIETLAAMHQKSMKADSPEYHIRLLNDELLDAPEKSASIGAGEASGIKNYIDDNGDFIKETLSREQGGDKLLRISVEQIETIGIENMRGFLEAFQNTAHGYIELFSTERPEGVRDIYGVVAKDLPDSLREQNRNRTNTITIFPVFKGEDLSENKNKRWGNEDPGRAIIAPVGFNYDSTGLIRSTILGLRLSEIAENESYTENSNFVSYTLAEYAALCVSNGQDPKKFNLTGKDLIDMARGDAGIMVQALNKLIRLLPIMPINTEQLRDIYEHAREALIRA